MARLTLVSSIILLLCCAAAASTFEDSNPIRMVPDGLRGFESSVLSVLGQTRHAISFARFAYKHGKRYETVEEMKLRFEIFKENLHLIRSTNKKGLPYTLGVNRTYSFSLSFLELFEVLAAVYRQSADEPELFESDSDT